MISASQRPLSDNTQHSQQTDIHVPGGIGTHDLSRRVAVDLRLRPRDHWDRHHSHAPSQKYRIRARFTGHFRIVGPHFGTCFNSHFWRQEIKRWCLDFWKICATMSLSDTVSAAHIVHIPSFFYLSALFPYFKLCIVRLAELFCSLHVTSDTPAFCEVCCAGY